MDENARFADVRSSWIKMNSDARKINDGLVRGKLESQSGLCPIMFLSRAIGGQIWVG